MLSFAFSFSLHLHGFGFAQEDLAEAGWALSGCGFFRVWGLYRRADEGAVFLLVGFADGEGWRLFFGGHGSAVAAVLRGDLQAVDEDSGAAGVDAVRGERQDYFGQGELDGIGVFERGEFQGGFFGVDVGVVGLVSWRWALAGVGVEVAEVLVLERG